MAGLRSQLAPLPAAELSESVRWQLVETVYHQTPTLLAGGLVLTAAAIVGWAHTREPWFLFWAAASVVITLARFGLDRAFRRRRERADRVRIWGSRFAYGAWAMGGLLGIAAILINKPVEPFVRLLIISVQIVIIMGAVTRNAGHPPAARGQIFFGLVPLFIACVVQGDRDHLVYASFVMFEMIGALGSMRFLHRQTVRLLSANERNSALVTEVQRANAELSAMNMGLEAIATIDALTGIANRRCFDEVLAEEVRRADRESTDFSLIILDIDAFKGYNDLYGHQAGDECLRRIARALETTLRRPADLVARYGGEEFTAILPRTNAAAAAVLAETLRANVEALGIPTAAGVQATVTASVGVATFSAQCRAQPAEIIGAADEALYAAKAAGRNCVRRVIVNADAVAERPPGIS